MKFHQPKSEVYCWDGADPDKALPTTTHLGICAHQDDLEILALHGVIECFHQPEKFFSGVVVTNGAGSARDFEYANYTDEQMQDVRRVEQKKAAHIGEYAAQVLLDHPSKFVKDASETVVVDDIKAILEAAQPEVVYTHNLADKHDTHVAVALRTIAALRALPADKRPKKVIGCEVWRDLDWLPDRLKVAMDTTRHDNLQAALIGVFDSQVASGKRYDLAAAGRRKAHATFSESHGVDQSESLIYGMDMTELVNDHSIDPLKFIQGLMNAFAEEVAARVSKFSS